MSVKKGSMILMLMAVVCVLGLSGCCSLGLKTCSTTDELILVGNKDLNNCNESSSIPVTVRVYYLKQKETFLKSSFEELWRDANTNLKSDMVGSERSVTVTPGGEVPLIFVRPAEATHIGIIANFCRDAGAWHKVVELDGKGLRKIVNLNQVHMSVAD